MGPILNGYPLVHSSCVRWSDGFERQHCRSHCMCLLVYFQEESKPPRAQPLHLPAVWLFSTANMPCVMPILLFARLFCRTGENFFSSKCTKEGQKSTGDFVCILFQTNLTRDWAVSAKYSMQRILTHYLASPQSVVHEKKLTRELAFSAKYGASMKSTFCSLFLN